MTKTDWTPEPEHTQDTDPLSATGMFLRAFGSEATEPNKQPEEKLTEPIAASEAKKTPTLAEQLLGSSQSTPAPSSASGTPHHDTPGEFTRIFQAAATPQAAPQQPPAPPPIRVSEPKQAAAPAPGEFTRIFLKPAAPAPARPTPSTPPASHSDSNSPRMKGFSTPGVSDSASAEGNFTKFFQSRPATPAPAPPPQVPRPSYPTPSTAPAEEFKWPREPDPSAGQRPADEAGASQSATGLFASLSSSPAPREQSVSSRSFEPLPSFSPVQPPEPSTVESGSVTRLIQRLSQGTRTAPAEEVLQPAAEAAEVPPPAVSSEPGEFTRIISGSAIKASVSTPAPSAATPAPTPVPASPMPVPVAMPHLAAPSVPAPAIAPPAVQASKIAPPQVAAPKVAAPAVAAPKSKLQEMLPLLLVVNTFLLIVLIIVVIFALRAK